MALGGVGAQASQALASFTLQILAVRLLGLEALGLFGALYALIVLATAISSGFVGDSLTVLDRSAVAVRAGLQRWWFGLAFGLGSVAGAVVLLSGWVSTLTAVMFALAAAMFLLEDALRRLLMAHLRFWSIVVVDLAGLAAALGVIMALGWLGEGVQLWHLFAALAAGQAFAGLIAVPLLPRAERHLAPWRPANVRAVWAYGLWRALQQAVRPGLQASIRWIALAIVSVAAVGEFEAARIFMAPGMIVVAGVASVLFAKYARDGSRVWATRVASADRHAALIAAMLSVVVVVGVSLMPWAGPVLTGGEFALSLVAVTGWGANAVAMAAASPYMALAAVSGRQVASFWVRLGESALCLALAVGLLSTGVSLVWIPFVLAGGALLGGVVVRLRVLRVDH